MKYHALFKYLLAGIGGLIAAWAFHFLEQDSSLDYMVGWVVFGIIYAISSVHTFRTIPSNRISARGSEEDVSSWLLFSIVLLTCVTALISISTVLEQRAVWNIPTVAGIVLCISAVGLSWITVHLAFTFRYAHLYYGESNKMYEKHAKGLQFPGEDAPDYWDFLYFSMTIGMTFQVSDVTISAKAIRRLVLIHGVISFLFNTVIIALTINEMVSLKS
jgi:uncharacterized membrane protein